MKGLKDALLKAGLKATPDKKEINKRQKTPKKKITSEIKNQVQRNFCEDCDQIQPDVELYKHRNASTDAEWICIRCADRLMIADRFRKTAQSDTSIRKIFRREYGETLSSAQLNIADVMASNNNDPQNGNR
jgi:translation initiation factor 2 beta subunit (eIF-2beta)/eIF-5